MIGKTSVMKNNINSIISNNISKIIFERKLKIVLKLWKVNTLNNYSTGDFNQINTIIT